MLEIAGAGDGVGEGSAGVEKGRDAGNARAGIVGAAAGVFVGVGAFAGTAHRGHGVPPRERGGGAVVGVGIETVEAAPTGVGHVLGIGADR